jgi:hypothetical protein
MRWGYQLETLTLSFDVVPIQSSAHLAYRAATATLRR